MTIATDVPVLLGRDLTATETSNVDRLVELAEGVIEGALPGFTIEPGTETASIDPGNPDELWTPRYPVSAVNSVTIDGTVIGDTIRFTDKGRIRLSTTALNAFELNLMVLTTSTVTVDYDYGFDTIPNDVTAEIANVVAAFCRRTAANPDGLASTTLGAYSESHFLGEVQALAAGMTLTPGALNRWRRNRQLSVPMYR